MNSLLSLIFSVKTAMSELVPLLEDHPLGSMMLITVLALALQAMVLLVLIRRTRS